MQKIYQPLLDQSLPKRLYWQRFVLDSLVRQKKCDLLFVPGGLYSGSFRPYVTMSQNLLPFDSREIVRYGFSKEAGRLLLLQRMQGKSFSHADGVIFLSNYARKIVSESMTSTLPKTKVIPHGVSHTFRISPKSQKPVSVYTFDNPYHCLYVSTITVYKHQWYVVEAVAKLRKQGYPIVLELVGTTSTKKGGKLLKQALQKFDSNGEFVLHRGFLPHEQLAQLYQQADCFIFASSCETFGQVVTEASASGLPIACSRQGPMIEILGENAIYFNPEDPQQIADALQKLIDDPNLRAKNAQQAYKKTSLYSWQRCANSTFAFMVEISKGYMVE